MPTKMMRSRCDGLHAKVSTYADHCHCRAALQEVSVKEFKALVKKGTVNNETEVWVDGKLDDWLPFGEVGMDKLLEA